MPPSAELLARARMPCSNLPPGPETGQQTRPEIIPNDTESGIHPEFRLLDATTNTHQRRSIWTSRARAFTVLHNVRSRRHPASCLAGLAWPCPTLRGDSWPPRRRASGDLRALRVGLQVDPSTVVFESAADRLPYPFVARQGYGWGGSLLASGWSTTGDRPVGSMPEICRAPGRTVEVVPRSA